MPLETMPTPRKAAAILASSAMLLGAGVVIGNQGEKSGGTPIAAAPLNPEQPTITQPATTTVEHTTTITKTIEAAGPTSTQTETNSSETTDHSRPKDAKPANGNKSPSKTTGGSQNGNKDQTQNNDGGQSKGHNESQDDENYGEGDDGGYGDPKPPTTKPPYQNGQPSVPAGQENGPKDPGSGIPDPEQSAPTNPETAMFSQFSSELFSKDSSIAHGFVGDDSQIYTKDGGFSIHNAPYKIFQDKGQEATLMLGYPSQEASPRDPDGLQYVAFHGQDAISSLRIYGSSPDQAPALGESVGALQDNPDNNPYFLGADGTKMGQTGQYNAPQDRPAYHFVQQDGMWELQVVQEQTGPKG